MPDDGTATLLYKPWEHDQGTMTLLNIPGTGDQGLLNVGLVATAARPRLYGPNGDLNPVKVVQGNMNDCWFLGPLFSLATINPNAIKAMIMDNNDGACTVKFPYKSPVTITYRPANLAAGAYTVPDSGIWMRVMEQAAAQYYNEHPGDLSWLVGRGKKAEPLDNLNSPSGYWPGPAIELLTGKESSGQSAAGSIFGSVRQDWQQIIMDGIKNGTPVALSLQPTNYVAEAVGLMTGHTYAVIDFDPVTGMVTVRDPVGAKEYDPDYKKRLAAWRLLPGNATRDERDMAPPDGNRDGVFQIHIDTLHKIFNWISYVTPLGLPQEPNKSLWIPGRFK